MPDEKIEPAVIIKIGPGSGLCRSDGKQAAFDCDIRKCSVPIVAKQGLGLQSIFPEPGSSEDEDIHKTIIVIIGLLDVQSAFYRPDSRRLGHIGEGAVAI